MPFNPLTPVLTRTTFAAMGTTTTVAVGDARSLQPALAAAREVITAIDDTCSRFKPQSELSRLNREAGSGAQRVSPLLAAAIDASLGAAAATGGLVDPTMGRLIERIGYTVTFRDMDLDGPALEVERRAAPGFTTVIRDGDTVLLTDDTALDIGAVGKAWAADMAANAAAERIGDAALVCCGGDVAVAGETPSEGWRVRVSERPGHDDWQDVFVHDGGVATSGVASRTWMRGHTVYHHILDPASGLPVVATWRTVTVAAATCAQANAAATAAIILGDLAVPWLQQRALPARLVGIDGSVTVIGGWPDPD